MKLRKCFLITIMALCSFRTNALVLKNGVDAPISIRYIHEGLIKFGLEFPGASGKMIQPGESVTVENKIQTVYGGEEMLADFDKLRIAVEYKGTEYNLETGDIESSISQGLANDSIAIIFKKPADEWKRNHFYFDAQSPINQLNARFDPHRKLR